MTAHVLLCLGLAVFLGSHSLRFLAPTWRDAQVSRLGAQRWKGLFSVVSLLSFVLIVWAYGQTRAVPTYLWSPPDWTRHLAALLMTISFVLLAAVYVPGNRIKAAVGHPMVAGTKLWAASHLITNGTLADGLLFGSFVLWAIFDFRAARQRDRSAGTIYPHGPASRTVMTVIAGIVAAVVFAHYLHAPLIGVHPFAH